MSGDVALDGLDVDALLRQQRSRNGRHRKQQQQDQCSAHAGEVAPEPPDLPHTGTDPGPTLVFNQMSRSPHRPVASAKPTRISMAPPIRVTQTLFRRTAL